MVRTTRRRLADCRRVHSPRLCSHAAASLLLLPLLFIFFRFLRRDTAGQERFHSLTSMFLKGANMVLLVFDMTRADSFESLTLWRDQFLKSTKNDADFPFAVVANKCDVATQRAVSQRRANTSGQTRWTEARTGEGRCRMYRRQ